MNTLSYKTVSANKATVEKKWVVVDAKDAILGRLSSEVARILRGKHKPSYTPHVDCGDNVIVINAAGVKMTGNKMLKRELFSHTGYPGGQRRKTPREIMEKKPEILIEHSVRGMLPKNRLGRAIFKNLYVYEGAEHPHEAQQPTEIKL
ncbi:MAG: 50S ribosomal protein L13 [Cyclobacteriaceae bacterium]|nr:50S ribosomal protein L13 [Cyclobacteriaceae bacterium]MCH8515973.1 50S ribosomal protein L13 [Cyclobacteriaceae bacterium]